MTEHRDVPKGFEARLLHALIEIDAARPAVPAAFSPAGAIPIAVGRSGACNTRR